MSRWVCSGAAHGTEKEDLPPLQNQGFRFGRFTGDARETSKQWCHHVGELELMEEARARETNGGLSEREAKTGAQDPALGWDYRGEIIPQETGPKRTDKKRVN